MAFKTFAPGVLTSSDVNTFLMRQAVITCTSSTRPSGPSEGMTIYETDTDLSRQYNGSAWEVIARIGEWQTYTVGIDSVGTGTDWSLGNATTAGRYMRVGRTVIVNTLITWGSTSSYGSKDLVVNAPVTIDTRSNDESPIGICISYDASAGNGYHGVVLQSAGGGSALRVGTDATSLAHTTRQSITSTRPFTWASGDYMNLTAIFEAAS